MADTFDALTTDRPYRAAVTIEQATATLRGERGHQLDPQLVDALLADQRGAGDPSRFPPEPARAARTAAHAAGGGRRLSAHPRGCAGSLTRAASRPSAPRAGIAASGTPTRCGSPPRSTAAEGATARASRRALPALGATLRRHGRALAAAAARRCTARVRRAGSRRRGRPTAHGWLETLAAGCETGRYERALTRRRRCWSAPTEFGATLLERHALPGALRAAAHARCWHAPARSPRSWRGRGGW